MTGSGNGNRKGKVSSTIRILKIVFCYDSKRSSIAAAKEGYMGMLIKRNVCGGSHLSIRGAGSLMLATTVHAFQQAALILSSRQSR